MHKKLQKLLLTNYLFSANTNCTNFSYFNRVNAIIKFLYISPIAFVVLEAIYTILVILENSDNILLIGEARSNIF